MADHDSPNSTGDSASTPPIARLRGRRRLAVLLLVLIVVVAAYAGARLLERRLIASANQPTEPVTPSQIPHNPINDLKNVTIPQNEILDGGPGKDGIPAISAPAFIPASEADFLPPGSRVIGVARNAEACCYPIGILDLHECVNDEFGGVPIAVTYCPLSDSSLVFDRRVEDRTIEFGVSGLLYNSNLLLYDRAADDVESLWSQMKLEAVTGDDARTALRTVPFEVTTWSDWSTRHPATRVLSPDTGHDRDYTQNPYAEYFSVSELLFPAVPVPDEDGLSLKSPVLGVWTDDAARAYPLTAFESLDEPATLDAELNGLAFQIAYDPAHKTLRVLQSDDGLNYAYVFWFAWYAFHPQTELYDPSAEE